MALLKRTAKYTIGNYKITVDADDVPRLETHDWKLTEADQNQLLPYADIGRPGEPLFLPLANFILSAGNDVYVEHKNHDHQDFRKTNLRK
jgi:hypothetical protein